MTETTKEKIARNGLNLMKQKGYDNVTINEICKESNISKHTFYYHFDSKEGIIKHFIVDHFTITSDIVLEVLSTDNPIDQYLKIIRPRTTKLEELGVEIVRKLLNNNLHEPIKAKPTDTHKAFDLEISLIKKAQDRGEITNQEAPEKLAKTCFILMLGFAQMWATSEGKTKLTSAYLNSVQTVLGVKTRITIE